MYILQGKILIVRYKIKLQTLDDDFTVELS